MKKTIEIAGVGITLEEGKRYWAQSPIATDVIEIVDEEDRVVIRFEASGYEERCDFLNAFNNEEHSWSGRVW